MPFRDVPGHRRLTELLARSIRHDTLPPSLLFVGPSDGGARDTAIALAQTLNCLDASRFAPKDGALEADACGQCSACTRIARGIHPDVLLVEPGDTGSIKIEQVRDVVERTAYRPFEGRRRIVIIDHAEAMPETGQNALLKTLEEPPPSSVFLLITALPDQLLPTVRSRMIRLSFADLGKATSDDESLEIAGGVLAQAAAGGDASRRLEAAKDLLATSGGVGAHDRDQLGAHLRAMASLLRDIAALATGADPRVLAHADARPSLARLVNAFRGERSVRAFAAVDRALAALEANAGVKVVADWVVLQL
jgi:DNA polymerase III subunit delta'